jgi:hypothetical protein
LPPGIAQVQRRLLTIPGGDREFVAILCAARTHAVDLVEPCAAKPCRMGPFVEMILNLIARELDPPAVDPISTPDALCLNHEPVANCARYDALRLEVDHAAA